MECDKIQEQLSAYLDGALSSAEREAIDNHLKSCPECRKSRADLEMTVRSVRGLDEIIPPPWLTQKIMARVKAEEEQKRSFWQKLFYPLHVKLPIEALGAALIALTALYLFKSMGPKINTLTAPSETTVSEYASKEKEAKPGPATPKPSQPPIARSNKDETAVGAPSQQESALPPSPPAEQPMAKQPLLDQGQSVEKKRYEAPKPFERDMLMKTAPSPEASSVPKAASRESAPQSAGSAVSDLQEKEEISISLRTGDIDSAKRGISEVLSRLGGIPLREEHAPDGLIITVKLAPDKMRLFTDGLKKLGTVKEKALRPVAGKERVLIKITVSDQ